MARGTGEITIRERVTFASGDFFVGGGASLLSVLYLIFLTDVVKLAPGLAGTAVLVAKLWDAANDPLVGNISDRARTRWGRRRPFIIVGALLLVPVMALFWWPTPPPTSQIGLAAWAALTYIAYNSVQTVISVPYASLSTEISTDFDQRNKVNVLRLLFSTVASAGTTRHALGPQHPAYTRLCWFHSTSCPVPLGVAPRYAAGSR